MKFKGGILYYSLLVIIICSSIIGFILLGSYYENRRLLNSIKQDELERNVLSAIDLFLGGEDIFKGMDTSVIDLFGSRYSRVTLTKKKWGNYYLISAFANWKHLTCMKKAIIGSDIHSKEHIGLYLADEGRFLSLSGKTILGGTCYLPDKTARRASIEGQQYNQEELVKGEIMKSSPFLPELNNKFLSFVAKYVKHGITENDSIINIRALDSSNISNSFRNKTIIIYNDCFKDLANYSFSGNIIVWCTNPLIIEESTHFEDAIIFAPGILIKSGFTGELQAYALQWIDIEKDCDLRFPSQLVLMQSESKYNPSDTLKISIGEGSRLEGGILIKSSGLTTFLKINSNARITGQVYNPGIVELKGDIIGTLYCRSFFLSTSRARYYNHLLNVKIDFNSLSKYFAGTDLISEISSKSIIKWVN